MVVHSANGSAAATQGSMDDPPLSVRPPSRPKDCATRRLLSTMFYYEADRLSRNIFRYRLRTARER